MRLKTLTVLSALVSLFLALNACAVKEPPEACNCNTVDVSAEEIAGGCPASVKEQVCRLYREKERLQREEEQRRLEKSMEPKYIPRN